jgi:hypothetical protein
MAMRYQLEFIRLAPHGDAVVVETIMIEAATLREAEVRAHAHFEDINVPEMADGFRILQDRHTGEVLQWIRNSAALISSGACVIGLLTMPLNRSFRHPGLAPAKVRAALWKQERGALGTLPRIALGPLRQKAPSVCLRIAYRAGGIVRVNSILPARALGRAGAPLFLFTNHRRTRPDSTLKMAYTYLP